MKHRSADHVWRNTKIQNARLYKTFPAAAWSGRVVLNCKSFDDTALMFYQNVNAYQWYPTQPVVDSLKQRGHRFVALQYPAQPLPAFLLNDAEIPKIEWPLE